MNITLMFKVEITKETHDEFFTLVKNIAKYYGCEIKTDMLEEEPGSPYREQIYITVEGEEDRILGVMRILEPFKRY